MYYKIKNIEDLNRLPSKKNIELRRITIEHPHIDRIKLNKLEEKLNKNYFACGCKTGSSFTLFGIVICAIHLVFNVKTFSINTLFYYFTIVIAAALTGKLVGLLDAKFKLIKIRKEIAELYSMSLYQEDTHAFIE